MQTLVIDTSIRLNRRHGRTRPHRRNRLTHPRRKLQVNIARNRGTSRPQTGKHRPHHRRHRTCTLHRTTRRIVAAKALASPPGTAYRAECFRRCLRNAEHDGRHHLTLAERCDVKQLYFTLLDGSVARPVATQAKTKTQTFETAVWKP